MHCAVQSFKAAVAQIGKDDDTQELLTYRVEGSSGMKHIRSKIFFVICAKFEIRRTKFVINPVINMLTITSP